MIASTIFLREMHRVTQSDTATGAIGLHVAAWMLVEGRIDENVLRALYSEVTTYLHTEQQMVAFANWMLKQNAAGRMRYFPKQAEIRTALSKFIEQNPAPKPVAKPVERAWVAPAEDPRTSKLRADVVAWWGRLDQEMCDTIRTEIIKRLVERNQLFTASYLEEKAEGWRDPERSPMVMTELVDYYRRTFLEQRREHNRNMEAS